MFCQDAIKTSFASGDSSFLPDIYALMGEAYFYADDLEAALSAFKEQERISVLINKQSTAAAAHNNIGIVYRNMGDNAKAIEYYEKSLKYKEKQDDKESVASTYNNIGVLYQEEKKYALAKEYYQKAYQMSLGTPDKIGTFTYLINTGEAEMFLGNFDKAIELANKGYTECQRYKYIVLQEYALGVLFQAYQSKNDYQKAFEYHVKYSAIKDSVLKKETAETMSELNVKYKTEAKNKEIQLQQLEIDKQKQALRQKTF